MQQTLHISLAISASYITMSSCNDLPHADLHDACQAAKTKVNCKEVKLLGLTSTSRTMLVTSYQNLRVLKVTYGDDSSHATANLMQELQTIVPLPGIHYHGEIGNRFHGWFMMVMEYIDNAVLLSEFQGEPTEQFYKEMRKIIHTTRSHSNELPNEGHYMVRDSYFKECTGEQATCVIFTTQEFMDRRTQQASNSTIDMSSIACESVLSHCDLLPRNIFISYDGNHVVSIIDWEMAGYYPDFYEFYKYLHEFETIGKPPTSFTSKWLDLFRTSSVQEVYKYEMMVHEQHCIKYGSQSNVISVPQASNATKLP